jgi:hypothetical protein
MARIEELTDIPPSEVDGIVADYKSEGATVEKIKQADGNWIVRATFPALKSSKNEDELDCCDHGIKDSEAVPDEDLPVAVGGVE